MMSVFSPTIRSLGYLQFTGWLKNQLKIISKKYHCNHDQTCGGYEKRVANCRVLNQVRGHPYKTSEYYRGGGGSKIPMLQEIRR